MAEHPSWHVVGDWFDVCKCRIPCPCTFAQAPSEGDCDGILAWHVRQGSYGRRPARRPERRCARLVRREHLGRRHEGDDGHFHR